MNNSVPAPVWRLLPVLSLGLAGSLAAQTTAPERLAPYVTTATRTPIAVTTAGSAIDTISAEEIARMPLPLLRGALASIPGAPAFANGATGGAVSLFLRGANSNQTLFLVDGLRFNDPNTDYQVALGGASFGAGDSLEVARGPQSTLYGGEAVGGVVSLRAQRGRGPARQSAAVEAGSFGTAQGAFSAQAGDEQSAYTFSAAGGHTDNARANNAFDSATYALRVDKKISAAVALGATWRGFVATSGDPGAVRGFGANDPDNELRESNQTATVFADLGHGGDLTSHVTLGWQDRRFVSDNPSPFGNQTTVVKNRRAILDWQSTYTANTQHRLTAGFTGEINHTVNTGFGNINRHQNLLAIFAQDEWSPVQNVYLTAGLRSDDFDTFGRTTTGRVTAAWLTHDARLKLRASYGTGFRAPSFLDLFGQSAFYVGNPSLKAESARGWDAGVDYYLGENRGTLSATWFQTDLRDLITFDFSAFPGTVINVGRARTRGLELSGKFTLPGAIEARASYTYLEADNLSAGTRLLRRPRHSGALDLWHDFGGGFSAGTGLAFVAQREDVDAATFATIDGEDYTVVRVYGAWQVTKRVAFKARVENLLNQKYEEVNGFPALGFGAFAGVEVKW
ncbi:MAG: TonB-dependent receptor [Opitutae bacterium]|nr:TonB-dependent receptor [Opitutae bacterium]